jgi:dTDP-4-dehydrorhamnose reductase
MSKILLIGKGHLGHFLLDELKIPYQYYWTADIDKLDEKRLTELNPDVVVNAAGKTDLKWAEENKEECWRCNVSAPLYLYRRIKKTLPKTTFIHLSSGCIWDGPYAEDGRPFGPTDPPTPACFYAWTKAACDAFLLTEIINPIIILRPRQVYSPIFSPRNTLSKLRGYKALLDTPNSMTSASTIAKTISIFSDAINRCSSRFREVNVYDKGITSPFEVGMLMAEAGLREKPEELIKTDLDVWHKPKRVDAVLKDEYFEDIVKPPDVHDELKRNIELYKENDIKSKIKVVPFIDGGPQSLDWHELNCSKCRKGHDQNWHAFPYPCSIEDALFKTAMTTEDVSLDIAQRMGCDKDKKIWRCPEFEEATPNQT